MTPELTRACELIFQEHKHASQAIAWNKEPFKGRISMGLCEKAKDTLQRSNVIIFQHKSKKLQTILNPAVTDAEHFQEAMDLAKQRAKVTETAPVIREYEPVRVAAMTSATPAKIGQYIAVKYVNEKNGSSNSMLIPWYQRSFYYYVVWPTLGLLAGALIARALGYLAGQI